MAYVLCNASLNSLNFKVEFIKKIASIVKGLKNHFELATGIKFAPVNLLTGFQSPK